ncbi:hypothetical protein [Mycetocola zhujimingii]|uniref:hypothetical protein n=1 Tax=Mycetocola zhujimingii TaxID=2079792 RepID=UPI0013C52309|nr:hypothetical protein [Mycetocola zhujimingii]
MANLTDNDGDIIVPDDEELAVLPDEDDDPFEEFDGLDEERPIDDTDPDLDGVVRPEDL